MLKHEHMKPVERRNMRNRLIVAFLMSSLAHAANAQQAPPPGASPNSASPGSVTTAPVSGEINHAGSFGLGPMVGEPTGLTMKFWFSERSAVDGGLGWSFVDPDGFQLHADYLYHAVDLFRSESGELPLYFGVGGRAKFVDHGDNRAGIRGPIGLSYLIPNARIEVFAEVAPILDFAPTTTLEWNGGVGLRFYLR
jgi:hypothetical protein